MARTKASVGSKVSSGKSSKARCTVAQPSSSTGNGSSDKGARSSSGGNPVCPRETPKWQKPITRFFICKDETEESNDENLAAGSSTGTVEQTHLEVPKTQVLDDSLELEPLNGEDSHKIEEYYSEKGKGRGKRTRGKENTAANDRKSLKRDRSSEEAESETAGKKVKVSEDVV